jgi:hypothetical protein
MATQNEPTFVGQLWAKVEPTMLSDSATATERIHARGAFLSGTDAVLVVTKRAKERGGGRAVLDALYLRVDLKARCREPLGRSACVSKIGLAERGLFPTRSP